MLNQLLQDDLAHARPVLGGQAAQHFELGPLHVDFEQVDGGHVVLAQHGGEGAGGAAQGLGLALMEELELADGRITNPTLREYLIPTTADVPRIVTVLVEDPHPEGPYGAKGIGEPSLVGAAPAIANAIHAATGVRLTTLPMTPERVLDALEPRR